MNLSEKAIAWIEARGLDPELAVRLGLETSHDSDGGETIVIPYMVGTDTVNHKYRTLAGKRFRQDKDAVKAFWNYNVIVDPTLANEPLVITEGEFDAMAAIQCGFVRTVSVPDGAPAEALGDDDGTSRKYTYLEHARSALRDCKEVILATDSDGPGRNLMNDLSIRIGKARCKWVGYPKGCKDLNDTLLRYGVRGVHEVFRRAQWCRVDGIYRMNDLPPYPDKQQFSTGFECLDKHYRVRMGDLCVITGRPGDGKSTFVNDLLCRLVDRYQWTVAIASFEQHPQSDHRRALREWFCRCPISLATDADIDRADVWINQHFVFIVPDDDDLATLEWTLDKCAAAVIRHGARVIAVDPWNELDHDRPADMSLTEYTGRAIKELKRLARHLDVHMIVVAHPTKLQAGEKPGLYSISDCYSADTEVLTARGWRLHSEVRENDDVMCFDPDNERLSWARPSRIIECHYSGEMINFKGYGYDLLVTPNHRMLVKPAWDDPVGTQALTGIGRPTQWPKGKWSFARADEIGSGARFMLPKAGLLGAGDDPDLLEVNGSMYPALPFLELVGWWLAEGSFASAGASLCQAVGDKADEIDGLINVCGLKATRAVRKDRRGFQPMVTWYLGARDNAGLVKWLRDKCGEGAANKRIPYPVWAMTQRLKTALLNGYISGDGHRPKSRDGISAVTTSLGLRDDLMRLAVEIGVPVCCSERRGSNPAHHTSYQINFGRPERREVTLRGVRNVSRKPYDGKVFCLTVPSGAYVTRRNGSVSIAGNSAHWANKPDVGIILWKPSTESDRVEWRQVKSRYHDQIGYPGTVWLRYVPLTRHFEHSPAPEEVAA